MLPGNSSGCPLEAEILGGLPGLVVREHVDRGVRRVVEVLGPVTVVVLPTRSRGHANRPERELSTQGSSPVFRASRFRPGRNRSCTDPRDRCCGRAFARVFCRALEAIPGRPGPESRADLRCTASGSRVDVTAIVVEGAARIGAVTQPFRSPGRAARPRRARRRARSAASPCRMSGGWRRSCPRAAHRPLSLTL